MLQLFMVFDSLIGVLSFIHFRFTISNLIKDKKFWTQIAESYGFSTNFKASFFDRFNMTDGLEYD